MKMQMRNKKLRSDLNSKQAPVSTKMQTPEVNKQAFNLCISTQSTAQITPTEDTVGIKMETGDPVTRECKLKWPAILKRDDPFVKVTGVFYCPISKFLDFKFLI